MKVGNGLVWFKTRPMARYYEQRNESSASVGGRNFLNYVGDYRSELVGPQKITSFIIFVLCECNMRVSVHFYDSSINFALGKFLLQFYFLISW